MFQEECGKNAVRRKERKQGKERDDDYKTMKRSKENEDCVKV